MLKLKIGIQSAIFAVIQLLLSPVVLVINVKRWFVTNVDLKIVKNILLLNATFVLDMIISKAVKQK